MRLLDVLKFIKKHELMMLATVNADGEPQAAVVEFGELDELTIIFDTLTTSRKYKNLQANSSVALVIGWDENITVQIDGIAHELSGSELAAAKQAYFAKNPRAQKWETRPNVAYFAIKPSWVRYSDLNQDPWLVEEINLPEEVLS